MFARELGLARPFGQWRLKEQHQVNYLPQGMDLRTRMKNWKTYTAFGVGLVVVVGLWLALSEGLSAGKNGNQVGAAGVLPRWASERNVVALPTDDMQIYLPLIAGQIPPTPPKIAFESVRDGNYEIYLMNPDGSDQMNLTRHRAKDAAPAWSPDGNRIAFVSDRDGNEEIYVMNRDGTGIVRLTYSEDSLDGWPTWSPDGTQIAFQSDRSGGSKPKFDIYVMNADGSGQRAITSHPTHDRWPAWSPDGAWITFTSNRLVVKKVYLIRPDGSDLTRLSRLNVGYDDRYSTWSPDGRLTFVSNREAPSDGSMDEEVYIMGVNGSNVRQLTDNDAGDWLARWAPDGERFVFYSDRDGEYHKNIFVKVLATAAEIRLTGNTWNDEYPVWSP
jgi:TolB protein